MEYIYIYSSILSDIFQTSFLTFYMTLILSLHLASFLKFYLTWLLALILAFFLAFASIFGLNSQDSLRTNRGFELSEKVYLAYILRFYLAFVRVQACPAASRAGHTPPAHRAQLHPALPYGSGAACQLHPKLAIWRRSVGAHNHDK